MKRSLFLNKVCTWDDSDISYDLKLSTDLCLSFICVPTYLMDSSFIYNTANFFRTLNLAHLSLLVYFVASISPEISPLTFYAYKNKICSYIVYRKNYYIILSQNINEASTNEIWYLDTIYNQKKYKQNLILYVCFFLFFLLLLSN